MQDLITALSDVSLGTVVLFLMIVAGAFVIIPLINKLLKNFIDKKFSNLNDTKKEFIRLGILTFFIFIILVVLLALMGTKSTPAMMLLVLVVLIASTCAKTTVESISSGLFLYTTGILREGQQVSFNGCRGVVTKLGMLYLTVKTYEGPIVHIPNSEVTSGAVTVNDNDTPYRIKITIPVSIDADSEVVCRILTDVAKNIPDIVEDKPIVIGIGSFNKNIPNYDCNLWVKASSMENARYEYTRKAIHALTENGIPLK